MRSVETEGATIDDAIGRALELLHIERDKVDIEIIENAARGVLGFGGKKARIRATVRSPLAADPSTRSESAAVSQETRRAEQDSPPAPRATDEAIESARLALLEILQQLGVETTVEIDRHDDVACTFRIPGSDAGIVIGRHGQTLDAIEYLLNRIVSQGRLTSTRIALDVEGYRERRQESVEQMARRAADKARHSGRPVTMAPMSARDRRTVHVTLSDERGITTRSQGEGSFRRVVVVPAKSGRV
jgi:spoIIIJ-associated protein